MRLAERGAGEDQLLGEVGGRHVRGVGGRLHRRGVELDRREEARHGRQAQRDLVDRVEEGLLVLLEIAVVGERKALEGGEQAGEVADQPTRLAAHELGDVGVLLLRHHRAAGRERIVERGEAELVRCPEHELLADARQVEAHHREGEQRLGDEVAVRHRVEAVLEPCREPEVLGHAVGVEWDG